MRRRSQPEIYEPGRKYAAPSRAEMVWHSLAFGGAAALVLEASFSTSSAISSRWTDGLNRSGTTLRG